MSVLKYGDARVPDVVLALIASLGGDLRVEALSGADANAAVLLQVTPTFALHGEINIARFLLRSRANNLALYDGDAVRLAMIDEWILFAERIAGVDGNNEDAAVAILSELNSHFTLRTFAAAHHVTLADVALWHAVRRLRADADTFTNKHKLVHLRRWFAHCNALPLVAGSATGSAARNVTQAKQRVVTKAGAMGSFDKIEVSGTAIVTRFPPEPSGYLHIGHVKAAMLNNAYARSTPGGRLHCRFDDTNPEKEKAEFENAILDDLASIDIRPDTVSHTSDFFGKFIEFAEKFIRDGNAYVDFTPQEKMREERGEGVESACRAHSVEENLRLWGEMVEGSAVGITCVLRAKIDMKCANLVMRDPAIYRCKLAAHHRTGTKFKVYPMYDFACPIIDSIEGITHALRSSEYTSRNPLYEWIAQKAGLRVPKIEDFSRLNFEYVLLSKRKLQKLVETGVVGGWDDPRFPTIRGILRRGIEVSVLREFILAQGASKNNVCMTMDKLWVLNKDALDKFVHRHVALPSANIVPVTLVAGDGVPTGIDIRAVEKHPKRPELGSFASVFTSTLWLSADDVALLSDGEEVTLIKWGNAVITAIRRDASGRAVGIDARLNLAGDVRATKQKLTWLPRVGDGVPGRDQGHLVDVVLREYGYLITVPTLGEDDDFDKCVNRNSELETRAFGAPSMRGLNRGDKIQVMRNGYFRVDEPASSTSPLVLIKIPDGSRGPLSPPATTE